MSQHGPYPGSPYQPWSGDGANEPYTAPSDPWGDHATGPEPWEGGSFASDPLVAPPSLWDPPPPPAPPRRRRNGPIVALVVVLGLLIAGGVGTTAWLLLHQPEKPGGQALPSTNPVTSSTAGPSASENARFVTKGQCVRNTGTTATPAITVVDCGPGTLVVLRRIDGKATGEADAELKCSKVPNYSKWYYYDTPLDSLDFVLCMREY